MSVRAIDKVTGDWTWGQGRQCYLTGPAEINQDCATALKVFLGEWFADTTFGVDWWHLIGGRDPNAIVLQCRKVLAARPGVTRINSVSAALVNRRLTVAYNVSTTYSLSAVNSVTINSAN